MSTINMTHLPIAEQTELKDVGYTNLFVGFTTIEEAVEYVSAWSGENALVPAIAMVNSYIWKRYYDL